MSPSGPLLSFCACRGSCCDEGGAPLVEAPTVFHGRVDCVIPLLFPERWAGRGGGSITYTTLGGSLTCVHDSAVGKYGMLLSSRQLFILLHSAGRLDKPWPSWHAPLCRMIRSAARPCSCRCLPYDAVCRCCTYQRWLSSHGPNAPSHGI